MSQVEENKILAEHVQDAMVVASAAVQAMTLADIPPHIAAGALLNAAIETALSTGSRGGTAELLRLAAESVEGGRAALLARAEGDCAGHA